MTIRELREKRARTVAAMKEIDAAPKGQGGALDETQETRWNDLKGELATLDKQIERQTLIDEADRRAPGAPVGGTGDDRLDTALQDFSLRRAMVSQIPDLRDKIDCARELELSAEVARRAGRPFQGMAVPMSVFHRAVTPAMEQRVITSAAPAGGPGGNLIQTTLAGGQYIDILRAALVTRRLGARVLSGLVGNIDIPRLKTSATTGWVAENSALTPSDQEHDKVSMTPKHAGALTEFSRNMLLQSSPDIEQLLRSDFAAIMARAVDAAALRGGGSNQPTGIVSDSGVESVSMSAGPSWAQVLEMIYDIDDDDGLDGALGWAAAPKVVKKLRSTVRVASTDSTFIMENARTLADYQVARSSQLLAATGSPALGELIFGNWADLLIGYWSELDLLINPYESTAYSKGNVSVRGMVTCDVALRHDESFRKCLDLNIA